MGAVVRMRSRRRGGEDGASAVEFALVVPFLIMILFGLITTGFAYNDHLSVTNATREGSRYGAAIDYTTAGWATSVRDRVKQTYFNAGSTLDDSQICVRIVDSSGTGIGSAHLGAACGTEPTTPTTVAGSCVVKVWVSKPQKISLIIFPDLNFDVGAQSVAYYGRTVTPGCPAQ